MIDRKIVSQPRTPPPLPDHISVNHISVIRIQGSGILPIPPLLSFPFFCSPFFCRILGIFRCWSVLTQTLVRATLCRLRWTRRTRPPLTMPSPSARLLLLSLALSIAGCAWIAPQTKQFHGFDLAADANGPGQRRHRGLLDPPAAGRARSRPAGSGKRSMNSNSPSRSAANWRRTASAPEFSRARFRPRCRGCWI